MDGTHKRELLKIAKSLLLVLVSIIVADFVYGVVCGYFYNHAIGTPISTRNYSFRESDEELLILGSSRAKHHYVPEVFTQQLGLSCHNAGEEGMCVFYHYALLSATIQRNAIPKIVILDVVESDLYTSPNTYFDLASAIERLRPYYGEFKAVDSILTMSGWMDKIKLQSAAYRFNSKLLSSLRAFHGAQIEEYNGYQPLYGEYLSPIAPDTTSIFLFEPLKETYMKKIFHLCRSNHVRLIVAFSPAYPYRESKYINQLKQLANENNVIFLNSDSLFCQPHLFVDEWHFNDQGARAYSEWIASKLK